MELTIATYVIARGGNTRKTASHIHND